MQTSLSGVVLTSAFVLAEEFIPILRNVCAALDYVLLIDSSHINPFCQFNFTVFWIESFPFSAFNTPRVIMRFTALLTAPRAIFNDFAIVA